MGNGKKAGVGSEEDPALTEPAGDMPNEGMDSDEISNVKAEIECVLQYVAGAFSILASAGVGANVKLCGSTIIKSRHKDWSELTVEFVDD